MFAAIRPGLTEPEGHFRSFFAVSTPKYGLARQSHDHMPPHFHAIYNDLEGVFELSTFEMLEGNLPARVKGLVIEWATLHKQDLQDNWNSLTNTGEYKKIDPLV